MRSRQVLPGVRGHTVCFLSGCVFFLFVLGGCKSHPLTDYRPLDKAGMGSSYLEELKDLNTSDPEVAQLVKLKQARIADDTCVALVSAAHQHQHPFASADSANSLAGAGYTEFQILQMAKADKLDMLSGDLVTLRLVGLSESTVQFVMDRRLQGLPVLSSAAISKLKNTGLTEKQIVEQMKEGLTEEQAEHEVYVRETIRNHSNLGFVRAGGRRR